MPDGIFFGFGHHILDKIDPHHLKTHLCQRDGVSATSQVQHEHPAILDGKLGK